MTKPNQKSVLFLDTGNYFRSRFAETLFNSVAGKFGLRWKADSAALALEPGTKNVGPIAPWALKALQQKGIAVNEDFKRAPIQVTHKQLDRADAIVALKQTEHEPVLQERYADWLAKVEFWEVDEVPESLSLIEHEVMDLVSRLVRGGLPRVVSVPEACAPEVATPAQAKESKTSAAVVRVGRETKGRRGKGVTTISDLPLDEAGLQHLVSTLKQQCGTGGTCKDGRIEIQGDQRERIVAALERLGYRVKRVGG